MAFCLSAISSRLKQVAPCFGVMPAAEINAIVGQRLSNSLLMPFGTKMALSGLNEPPHRITLQFGLVRSAMKVFRE